MAAVAPKTNKEESEVVSEETDDFFSDTDKEVVPCFQVLSNRRKFKK
jgi:hypothetical protein